MPVKEKAEFHLKAAIALELQHIVLLKMATQRLMKRHNHPPLDVQYVTLTMTGTLVPAQASPKYVINKHSTNPELQCAKSSHDENEFSECDQNGILRQGVGKSNRDPSSSRHQPEVSV